MHFLKEFTEKEESCFVRKKVLLQSLLNTSDFNGYKLKYKYYNGSNTERILSSQ